MRSLVYAALLSFVTLSPGGAEAAERKLNVQDGYGAAGYDTVSYVKEERAVKGRKDWKTAYKGTTYLFKNKANLDEFTKAPESYLPAYGGWCAYAMADNEEVEIDPETFKIIDGKTYLFYNGWLGNTLPKWNKQETELKQKADKAWSGK